MLVATLRAQTPAPAAWNAKAAGAYLDARQTWWQNWPNAARDHDTFCVSCHTAVPYAIARSVLRTTLHESGPSEPERKLIDNVTKRVRMWRDIEPFYPDQLRGLPKTSESRGAESVMNALILASRDAQTGSLSDDARLALDNMWALQFKTGEQNGAWAWLNFTYQPWESADSPLFGASLAAVAIGTAPGGYSSTPAIQDRLKALREYLHKGAETPNLFNRAMLLWGSSKLGGVLSAAERQASIDALIAKQQPDGGWSTATLAPNYKRQDGSALDMNSDGYATAVIAFVLQQADVPRSQSNVARGLTWLNQHQDRTDGRWIASSLNKNRDPQSDPGKFMSDAATAFAVLALTEPPSAHSSQR
jgi:squalene-hopene/tetraprenyl-beta-curcumene cyclase